MAEPDIPTPKAIGKIPPKRLALIAGGGIALGLAWRYWNKRSGNSSTLTTGGDGINLTDYMNTALPTIGGAAGGSPIGNDRRETVSDGSINLPIVSWLIKDDAGRPYLTDGDSFSPLFDPDDDTPTTPIPAPTTPVDPIPTSWTRPAWLSGTKFVRSADPSKPTGYSEAIYYVTDTGLEWVPSWDAYMKLGGFKSAQDALSAPLTVDPNALKSVPRIGAVPDKQFDSSLRI